MVLEWCKTYDVLHKIKDGNKFIDVLERLTFCKFCCNKTKIEFYNNQTNKRCRLSITAIKVITEDIYQYNLKQHNNLIEKIKGGKIW